ncbi:hypothetical protein B484DRAFT_408488 [Ochromonadaceae sp. CCMP2298]|nr:hypothetical protein B484DRAFT_408488 [Ochromonadaceae sp. CCMP2298]
MASMSTEVVVRTNPNGYESDASDKSAEYAPDPVATSPDVSKESDEPALKKAKKEHYTIVRQKEQVDLTKLIDKIIRMKDRKASDEEIYKFVHGYIAPKSRSELSGMLTGLTNPIRAYDKVASNAESTAVTRLIALESSSAKRRDYFDQINKASLADLTTELESQTEDMEKFKAKLKKATCNVRILRNKHDLAVADEKGTIAQEMYQMVLQAKKGKTNI